MNQIIVTLIPWILTATSLAGFLFCFVSFHRGLRALQASFSKRQKESSSALDAIKKEMANLREGAVGSPMSDAPVIHSSMNLNKRTQALRQLRGGQDSALIAKSLEISKAEVDLLIKVQSLVARA